MKTMQFMSVLAVGLRSGLDNKQEGYAFSGELKERFHQEMKAAKSTKKSALRLAIVGAIRDGILNPDERLPPEIELARVMNLSLGTVQSALGQLQNIGLVTRRRAGGTRVTAGNAVAPSIWHFRFRSKKTGEVLKLLDQEVELLLTNSAGPWTNHLGSGTRYLQIRRALTSSGDIRMGAEMFLNERFISLIEINARELQSTNLRPSIEKRFGVTTGKVDHEVTLHVLDARQAALFHMSADTLCYKLEARTMLTDGQPFYYQHIFVAADDVSLLF